MARTIEEIVEMIDAQLAALQPEPGKPSILHARVHVLRRMREMLTTSGFPHNDVDRFQTSLVPFIFQEANYDGIDWHVGARGFDHLQQLFDIDFYVAMGGRERDDVATAEEEAYWSRAHAFIERRTRP
jgi:hypothetical protein